MEPVASSSRADLQTGCSLASTSQEITFIESKKHIALCTALALLPPELKCDGWLYIMEDCPKTLNIEKFNDYFVSAWLDNEYYRGKWDFWGDIYRTNNPVEGSNAKLNRTYSGKLNIISFLNVIKNDAVLSLARQGKTSAC